MRILLAVDETGPSLLAARFAKRLYESMREASIVMVHVGAEGGAGAQAARAILDGERVPYTFEAGQGDPADMIVERAQEHHCDMIVIGSRQRGAVRSAVLGSVSGKVVAESTVPVVVVS